MTAESLIAQYGYLGIVLLLVLGGLGLPVPEEAPVVLAAILTRNAKMNGVLAFGSCLGGVLAGDFLVYFLGYYYGERVMSFRLARKFLTRAREEQVKGYFHRHGFKILIVGRFAVGFRTAAYLTAGILRVKPLKLLMIDLIAATLSTTLMFVLGYVFAHQIEAVLQGAQHWAVVIAAAVVAGVVLYRFIQGRRRAGQPVGPKLLVEEDVPLPPDDLQVLKQAADEPPPPIPLPSPTPALPPLTAEPDAPPPPLEFEAIAEANPTPRVDHPTSTPP